MERFLAWYRVTSSVGAVIALVAANAIPLLGVLFFGWNVWTILIVYWLENGIVGLFNIAKMAKAEGDFAGQPGSITLNGRSVTSMAKLGLIPFFVMHYGIFWLVHGVFVLTLPVFWSMGPPGSDGGPDMTDGFRPVTILVAVIALSISHAVSYWFNFVGAGEYRRVTAAGQNVRAVRSPGGPAHHDHPWRHRHRLHWRTGGRDRHPRGSQDPDGSGIPPGGAPQGRVRDTGDGWAGLSPGRRSGVAPRPAPTRPPRPLAPAPPLAPRKLASRGAAATKR